MTEQSQEIGKRQTTELSKISKPTQLAEVQVAKSGKLVCYCSDDEIKECLRVIFALTGMSHKLVPVGLPKELLIAFIRERINAFTLQELRLAFEYAVLQRFEVDLSLFGETFSPKTVIVIVESYRKHKVEVLSREVKTENKTEMTDDQKEEIIKGGVIKCFDSYKKSQNVIDIANVTYSYLEKKGLINLTSDQKKEIVLICKDVLLQDEKGKRVKRSEIKKAIDDIINGSSTALKSLCKRYALSKYFDNLIEFEIDLTDELNKNK